jgi:tetratricopeptide (TPR) repeat protein/transcriptional regulator with XRE-family HTH domain
LRRFRVAAGLTQKDLAERAGVSPRCVSDLERGIKQVPRTDTLNQLANALQLDAETRARFVAAAGRRIPGMKLPAPIRPATHPGRTSQPPLVGRKAQRSTIERVLANDGPTVLLLRGEPGIGKSRLLQAAAVLGPGAGWSVIAGGCTRRSGQEPFQPFVDALLGALTALPRAQQRRVLAGCEWLGILLPELRETGALAMPGWRLPPEQERRLMFLGLRRALAQLAGPAGTLLVLDDLQWAGADALDLLVYLVRGVGATSESEDVRPLRVVGAYRDTDVAPDSPLSLLVADLGAEGIAATLSLAPLAASEAEELLDALVSQRTGADVATDGSARWGGVSDDGRTAILRQAEGVPFYLVSMARALSLGEQSAEHRAAIQPAAGIPDPVAQSIRVRIALLPPPARDVLTLGAVVGRVLPLSLLRAALVRPDSDPLAACEVAYRVGLLVEDGVDYRFAHDLIREVALADLSRIQLISLHAAVADALVRLPDGPRERHLAEIAHHYLEAGDGAAALPYAIQAGDHAAAVYAHEEAERLYRLAGALASAQGDRRREAGALEKLGGIQRNRAARLDSVLETYHRAAQAYRALGDDVGLRHITVRSAETFTAMGDLARGRALLQPLIETSLPGEPESNVADMYLAWAWVCSDPAARIAAFEWAAEIAREIGDNRLLARAEFGRGNTLLGWAGRNKEARQVFENIIPLHETTGNTQMLSTILGLLANACMREGEFGTARRHIDRALEITVGTPMQLAWLHGNRGEIAYFAGEWQQAAQDFERSDSVYRSVGRIIDSGFARWGMGQIRLSYGQIEQASRLLEEAIACVEAADASWDVDTIQAAHMALAERDLVAGSPEAACARLEHLLGCLQRKSGPVTCVLPLLAWAYLERGDDGHAAALLQEALSDAANGPQWLVLVDALRVRAMLATRRRGWAEAEAALEEALIAARAMPYPYAELKALYVYGQLHAARGESERTRQNYQAALAICERLGEGLYRPHVERALAELERRSGTPAD